MEGKREREERGGGGEDVPAPAQTRETGIILSRQ